MGIWKPYLNFKEKNICTTEKCIFAFVDTNFINIGDKLIPRYFLKQYE